MSKQLKADLALLAVTAIWGSTFVITKNILNNIPTYNFLALRFILAFIISSIVFYKNMIKINKNTIIYGLMIGTILFLGYAFQTVGLNYTTPSKSGFITGFSVVIVPITSSIISKKLPNKSTIFGVLCAIIGLGFMTLDTSLSLNIGDLCTIICAFCFAFHIIFVGKYTNMVDSVSLAIIQIGVVGFISLMFSLTTHTFTLPNTLIDWSGIIYTGILATSGAYIIQNIMQKFTSPTHTALIYTAEPVFSAIFSFIILGDIMTTKAIIGSILILLGMILSEFKPKKNNQPQT